MCVLYRESSIIVSLCVTSDEICETASNVMPMNICIALFIINKRRLVHYLLFLFIFVIVYMSQVLTHAFTFCDVVTVTVLLKADIVNITVQ